MAIAVPLVAGNDVTVKTSPSATSLAPDKPSNLADGDKLYCAVEFRNSGAAGGAPAGWASMGVQETGTGIVHLWYKDIATASGEPASYTFTTPNGANRCEAILGRITGAAAGAAHVVSTVVTSADGGNASMTIAAVTTSVPNTVLIALSVARNASTTPPAVTPASGMTEIGEVSSNPSSSTVLELAFQDIAGTGSTGTRVPSWTPASSSVTGFMVALAPAPATPAPPPLMAQHTFL